MGGGIDHQAEFATCAHAMQDPKSVDIPESHSLRYHLLCDSIPPNESARRSSADRGNRGTTLPTVIDHERSKFGRSPA